MTKRSYAKLDIKAENRCDYLRKWRRINKDRLKQYRKQYLEKLIAKAIFERGYVKAQDTVHTDITRNSEMVSAACLESKSRPKMAALSET